MPSLVTNKSINVLTGLQDKQDIFAFPACPAKSGEERQKASPLRFHGFIWKP